MTSPSLVGLITGPVERYNRRLFGPGLMICRQPPEDARVNTRDIVQGKLAAVVAEHSPMPFPDAIDDDDELDIFGLDSLAFMSLLTAIEKEVGYIPKPIMEGDLYPETFGELVSAYDS